MAVRIVSMPMRSQDEVDVTRRVIERATATAEVSLREASRDQGDRRGKPRYAVALSVTLVGDHNFYVGLTENISEGGVFVRTQKTLPLGTRLRLEFSLPTCPRPISVVGEVRWVRTANALREEHNNFGSVSDEAFNPGMGVQFTVLSADALQAITTFMRLRRPDFYVD